MSRMANGLSKAVLFILERMGQRTDDEKDLEERMKKVEERWATGLKRREANLAAGEWHTVCVRQADGKAFSWGGGHHAADGIRHLPLLGQNQASGPCVMDPSPVVGLNKLSVREVSAGTMHALLMDADGGVWSCGVGKYGALGHGNLADQQAPRRIQDLAQVQVEQVAAGAFHSMALSTDGQAYSFGWGVCGRLGHGDQKPKNRPVRIAALDGVKICQVSAGTTHSLAVGEKGELYSWGAYGSGRLGLGERRLENQLTPQPVRLPRGVRIWQASAGGSHSLAVATDGALYSFGSGWHGRLGHGDLEDCWRPELIKALEGVKIRHCEAGMAHSIAHAEGGIVLTFGSNYAGLLGHSDEEECLVPTPVKALVGKAVTAVATGSYHTVVMLANGELQAFGSNEYGQLGAAKEGGPEPVGVSLPRI